MKLETRFELFTCVYYVDYQRDVVESFRIEKIEVLVHPIRSGGGGCAGVSIDERYYDEDEQYRFGHNLFTTYDEAMTSLNEYRKRFPVVICSECGRRK